MKRAVLITGHFPRQPRKPSLLWVSQHLQQMGWHVTHVTVGYSWISALRGDRRLAALGYRPERGTEALSASLSAIYGLPPLHPFKTGLRALDAALGPLHGLFAAYWTPKLRAPLAQADLVICESGAPVVLAPMLARAAPQAARIYRVNDDIRLLRAPDLLIRAQAQGARHFTRISTASPHLAAQFASHPNVTLDPMGIPHAALQADLPDPYRRSPGEKIAICAGTTQLDMGALVRTAQARPGWQMHVLGRLKLPPPRLPNLVFHGEQGFDTTLAHIAHADIGLAPYLDVAGVEYQTHNSNRILLYRHFGLPVLGPDRLCDPALPALIGDSAADALARCDAYGKHPEAVPDWSDLARALAQNKTSQKAVTLPPRDVSIVPETA